MWCIALLSLIPPSSSSSSSSSSWSSSSCWVWQDITYGQNQNKVSSSSLSLRLINPQQAVTRKTLIGIGVKKSFCSSSCVWWSFGEMLYWEKVRWHNFPNPLNHCIILTCIFDGYWNISAFYEWHIPGLTFTCSVDLICVYFYTRLSPLLSSSSSLSWNF